MCCKNLLLLKKGGKENCVLNIKQNAKSTFQAVRNARNHIGKSVKFYKGVELSNTEFAAIPGPGIPVVLVAVVRNIPRILWPNGEISRRGAGLMS